MSIHRQLKSQQKAHDTYHALPSHEMLVSIYQQRRGVRDHLTVVVTQ